MYQISSTPLVTRRQSTSALIALVILLSAAFYLELVGWRILNPEFSLAQAWNWPFVLGALYTALGSVLFGLLPLALGAVPRRTRQWSLSHAWLLWATGASIFLLAMAGLVMWAP